MGLGFTVCVEQKEPAMKVSAAASFAALLIYASN
jgi:hypothetical protein